MDIIDMGGIRKKRPSFIRKETFPSEAEMLDNEDLEEQKREEKYIYGGSE